MDLDMAGLTTSEKISMEPNPFERVYIEPKTVGLTNGELEQALRVIDKNKNGEVAEKEVMEALAGHDDIVKLEVEVIIQTLNYNNHGVINMKELFKTLTIENTLGPVEVRALVVDLAKQGIRKRIEENLVK